MTDMANDKPRECENCGATTPDVYDITTMAPFSVPPEYLCENCAERRYMEHQERLMEEK